MPISNKMLETLNTSEEKLSQLLVRDVREIFGTMIGMDDLLHLPIEMDPAVHFTDCISSLVGFGGAFNGLVGLHMPTELSMRATGCMLGMEVNEVDDDVNDAMGEIANMIAGSFKQHLSKGGLDVQLSTPSVVCGKEYILSLGSNTEQIAVRFATDDEWFMVAVAFDSN